MPTTPSPADTLLSLAGRILIAALFIPSAIAKIAGFAGVTGFIASKGLPLPALLAAGAIVLEIAAPLAILAGWRTRWAALALAAFTVLAAVLFHDFWAMPEAMQMAQRQAFFKNLGIAGGLLLLASLGAGRFGLDARHRSA